MSRCLDLMIISVRMWPGRAARSSPYCLLLLSHYDEEHIDGKNKKTSISWFFMIFHLTKWRTSRLRNRHRGIAPGYANLYTFSCKLDHLASLVLCNPGNLDRPVSSSDRLSLALFSPCAFTRHCAL